jgi:hypothetical protein
MVVVHALRLLALSACVLAACGGGRTPLRRLPPTDARPDVFPDLPLDRAPEARPDLPPEAARDVLSEVQPDLSPDTVPDLPPQPPDAPVYVTPGCAPVTETCNGVDDDCDGVVDDDIPPIPCPGGGFRYCMGGQTSDCPTPCAVCKPGGKRVCFISYCTYWGTQTCASDGQSWSYCVEQKPVPKACADVAADKKRSPATEQCCLDSGFCCVDEFDLNGNGDKTELLGRCEDVLCAPPR